MGGGTGGDSDWMPPEWDLPKPKWWQRKVAPPDVAVVVDRWYKVAVHLFVSLFVLGVAALLLFGLWSLVFFILNRLPMP